MLSLGIVGLPNVGKSTLFNALTKSKQAEAQNYPFCTIEPNVGVVEVPDERLAKLAQISKSKKIIPTAIEFIDIAGLVKGASTGEGLGNQFLSHIRECDAIVQVVRNFTDKNVTHVHGKIDPKNDSEIINLELVMADWQTVSKKLAITKKNAKGSALKEAQKELNLLEKLAKQLESGKPARSLEYDKDEKIILKDLHLLSIKPMLYVVNISDDDGSASGGDENGQLAGVVEAGIPQISISAKTEAELAELSAEDAKEYLKELGMDRSGLDKLITESYKLLNLVTFLTSGEPETRAWTVKENTKAPDAAGVIHTDFIKGFIKADVCKWEDFVEYNGWNGIKESGKLRLEGKDYTVQDGDVVYFHVST